MTQSHAFAGVTAAGTSDFVAYVDRPLEDGPVVLTIHEKVLPGGSCFQGFWGAAAGQQHGTFVEVPVRLVPAIRDCIEVALDNEDAAEILGVDRNDLEAMTAFLQALNRCALEDRQVQYSPVVGEPDTGDFEVLLGMAGWGVRDTRTGEFVADGIEEREGAQARAEYLESLEEWLILNPDDSVEYRVRARNEIEALDLWADSTDMGSYSYAIEQHILEGHGPEFSLPVYRHEGIIHAICTNYEVRVVPAADHVEKETPRELLVARFDVTALSADERDVLAAEVSVQGEDDVSHGYAPCVNVEIVAG